jgi:homoserine kinase
MHEQMIIELATKANLGPACESQAIAIKKFAELIVQECCDIFVELRTRPADLAVKDVKKHFGVEE